MAALQVAGHTRQNFVSRPQVLPHFSLRWGMLLRLRPLCGLPGCLQLAGASSLRSGKLVLEALHIQLMLVQAHARSNVLCACRERAASKE